MTEDIPAVMGTLAQQVAALELEKARTQGAVRDLLTDAGFESDIPLIEGIRQLLAQREAAVNALDRADREHARERLEWAAQREQLRTDLRIATGGARTVQGRYGDAG